MKRKGFTLIELLAVIIILGILMLIAIPSVTTYINNSRKQSYVATANELVKGANVLVNSGELDIFDTDTTYYIPVSAINTENGKAQSPYGDLEDAYVLVTYDGESYNYYYMGKDTGDMGTSTPIPADELNIDNIEKITGDIDTSIGVEGKSKVVIFNSDASDIKETKLANVNSSGNGQSGNNNNSSSSSNNGPSNSNTMFRNGSEINIAMKMMTGIASPLYYTDAPKILKVKRYMETPTDAMIQSGANVATTNSEYPIYMWFEEETGIIYWWSEVQKPKLNPNSHNLFGYLKKATEIDLEYFDFSEVTDLSQFFCYCESLQNIDIASIDTSNATTLEAMFYSCNAIVNLDLRNFDTSKVTNMSCLFAWSDNLKTINMSSFSTANVTDFSRMFEDCYSLTTLNFSNFNTSKATTMESMFSGCSGLTSLDLSSFSTSNVTDMSYMFANCAKATSINVSSFNTSNVTTFADMFGGCNYLQSLDLSNFNTSNATDMFRMFLLCQSITSLDLRSFNTSKVTNMGSMFKECSSLVTIRVSNSFVTSAVTYSGDEYKLFGWSPSLVGEAGTTYSGSNSNDITYAHIDGGISNPGYFSS